MRLAAADVVPLRYAHYGRALERELELRRREVIRERRVWEAAQARPEGSLPGAEATEARKKQPLLPDFAPLARAVERFGATAGALDAATARLEASPRGAADSTTLGRLNHALVQIERAFLDPRGLRGRPWFRHTLHGPGFTTGYSSWPFPAVVQALDDRDPAAFEAQLRALISRIDAAAEAMPAA
jgi:N-acetylated-alpha-linked acidic dipeptidase